MKKIAVFLDRDDTIIVNKHYLNDPDGVELLEGAAAGIAILNAAGIPVIMITNQSGIARGYLDEARLDAIHQRLFAELADKGARIDATYYCPHLKDAAVEKYRLECNCRKPRPGMLFQAARDFDLDLNSCYMVGDKPLDIEAIENVGGKGLLVKTATTYDIRPAATVTNLVEAARWILEDLNESAQ